jgi:multiple sugar transport system permease protein
MRGGMARMEQVWGWTLAAPYIIGLLCLVAGPIFMSLGITFFKWDNITLPHFVGGENWARLVQDPVFWKAFGNTCFFVGGVVPAMVVLSLLLAVLINRPLRGINVFRSLYFTPVVTSTVAVALVWTWFYDGSYGVLNYSIEWVFGLFGKRAPEPIAWLNNPTTALPAIMVMSVWKGMGYYMVIFLASLQGVPRHLYEAAEIDGAGTVKKFLHVTLPMISPVTLFVIIIATISSFQVFDQIFIMARGGGPANSTISLVYYLYLNAFDYLDMGYACAIGTSLFLIIMAVTAIQLYLERRWVYYS